MGAKKPRRRPMTNPTADSPLSLNKEWLLSAAHRLDQAITSYQTCAGSDGKLILDARYLVAAILFAVSHTDETH